MRYSKGRGREGEGEREKEGVREGEQVRGRCCSAIQYIRVRCVSR